MNTINMVDQVMAATNGYIARNLEAVLVRVSALETREPVKGEKGDAGDRGANGIAGADGKDGVGKDGTVGVDGKDGAPGLRGDVGETGPIGPAGRDGINGQDGTSGIDGKDADPLVVQALVARAVGEIPRPADGRDGRDGEPGRDAFAVEVLAEIDTARHYQRGTWAKHHGGLWMARAATNGMEGWDCIVDGIQTVDAVQAQDDPRKFALGWKMSSGAIGGIEMRMPVPMDKGIYKEDTEYLAGDGVTWGGSFWFAQCDTKAKPGDGESWRLAVKKGRDGRDGIKGDPGLRGAEGRAGADVTQMGPTGNKW